MTTLTMPNVPPENSYLGDGTQTDFPYTFPVLAADHLVVEVTAPGALAPDVVPASTITNVRVTEGGTVTLPDPPADGATVRLKRVTPTGRLEVFPTGGLSTAALNDAHNTLFAIIQETARDYRSPDDILLSIDQATADAETARAGAEAARDGAVAADAGAGLARDGAAAAQAAAGVVLDETRAARDETHAVRDELLSRLLPPSPSDPGLDGVGAPVEAGDLYFNTTDRAWRSHDGTAWVATKWVADAGPRYRYQAAAGQTVFTGADLVGRVLTLGADVLVFRNGALLVPSADYSLLAGTTLSLLAPCQDGDEVEVLDLKSVCPAWVHDVEAGLAWRAPGADETLVPGNTYRLGATGPARVLALPVTPPDGARVTLRVEGSPGAPHHRVALSGATLARLARDHLVLDGPGVLTLVHDAALNDWRAYHG